MRGDNAEPRPYPAGWPAVVGLLAGLGLLYWASWL